MPKEVTSGQDASKTKHNTSKNETNGTVAAGTPNGSDGNDAGVGSVTGVQNATDESSELSDLGDDSEAETDQMDFLEDGDDLNKKLDLRALSDLTQLARLQGVDSDEEDVKKLEEPHLGDEKALSLNPKDNEEANREIMKDIDAIHEELGQPTQSLRPESKVESLSESTESRPEPAKKRKGPDEERSRKKQKSVEVEPNVKNEENENMDEEADQIDSKVKPEDEPLDSGVHETVEETAEEAEAEAEDDEGDEEEADEADEPGAPAEEANSDEERGEDDEEDADMSEKRQAAVAELIEIEKAFASLRDKMYHDKLNLLEHELQLCVEGSHPELSKIYYKINAFHQDALRQANSNLSYRLKCIDRETVACRTAVHQNFLKQVYDSKSDMITNTTSMWYKINRERNQLDQLVPDYSYSASGGAFVSSDGNDDGSTALPQSVLYELVSQRNAINHQLGILNGLVEFSGIPAAVGSSLGEEQQVPELLLRKASEEEIADDLRAMGVTS